MLRKIYLLIAIFLIAVIPTVSAKANWTVMVYMDGDNNLEAFAIENFLKISNVGSTDNVNIVVLLDRAMGFDDRFGDRTTAKIFYVRKGMKPTPDNAVVDWGEVNMGDPQTLINFVNWSVSHYPAEHYMLILWDHGSGWKDRTLKGVIFDDGSEDYLTYSDLLQAFSQIKSQIGVDIDIVGFDACLMGMEEIDYLINVSMPSAIRVGSEEVELAQGWPYKNIIANLTSNPTMSPEDLAIEIVNDYRDFYTGVYPIYTISSVYVNNTIDEALNDLVNAIMENNSKTLMYIVRNSVEKFKDSTFVDLYNLAELILVNTDNQTIKEKAQALMDAINKSTIVSSHGIYHPNVRSVSIYFPESKGIYDISNILFGKYNETAFAKGTLWDEFLEWYYGEQSDAYMIIDKPGYYELNEDIGEQYRYGVVVLSSDVVINGNGHTIESYGPGILVIPKFYSVIENVTITNVTVNNSKVLIKGAGGKVENVVIDNCEIKEGGLYVYNGRNIVVRNSEIAYATADVVRSSDITLENNVIHDCWTCIGIYGCRNVTVTRNTIYNASYGLYVPWSENVSVTNNVIYNIGNDKDSAGIYVDGLYINISGNDIYQVFRGILVTLAHNRILENKIHNFMVGITLLYSYDSTIANNTIEYGQDYGIGINDSGGNYIVNNTIRNVNNGVGVLGESRDNVLMRNTFENCYSGISIYANLSDTQIYLNNFIDNAENIHVKEGVVIEHTTFNSTSKIAYIYNSGTYENYLGNYYSNYNAEDADNDGVIDKPYVINSHYVDYHPLAKPFENYIISKFETNKPDIFLVVHPNPLVVQYNGSAYKQNTTTIEAYIKDDSGLNNVTL